MDQGFDKSLLLEQSQLVWQTKGSVLYGCYKTIRNVCTICNWRGCVEELLERHWWVGLFREF